MATRSTIALKTPDGKFKAIYCHWDGYVEHNGKILFENYQDVTKVEKLISMGDLSSLGREIGEKHDFNENSEDVCTYYGRDRDEVDTGFRIFSTIEDVTSHYDWSDYYYFFIDGSWKVIRNAGDREIMDLGKALELVVDREET